MKIFTYVRLLFLYTALIVITLIISFTYFPISVPVVIEDSNAMVTVRKDTIEILYRRKYEVTREFSGEEHKRILYNPATGVSYEFAGTPTEFPEGKYERTTVMLLPASSPRGRYIVKTYIVWRPWLALSRQTTELPESVIWICNDNKLIC